MRAESAKIKYAEMMMTDGSRPPHQALRVNSCYRQTGIPYERQDITDKPNEDEIQGQRITSEPMLAADLCFLGGRHTIWCGNSR